MVIFFYASLIVSMEGFFSFLVEKKKYLVPSNDMTSVSIEEAWSQNTTTPQPALDRGDDNFQPVVTFDEHEHQKRTRARARARAETETSRRTDSDASDDSDGSDRYDSDNGGGGADGGLDRSNARSNAKSNARSNNSRRNASANTKTHYSSNDEDDDSDIVDRVRASPHPDHGDHHEHEHGPISRGRSHGRSPSHQKRASYAAVQKNDPAATSYEELLATLRELKVELKNTRMQNEKKTNSLIIIVAVVTIVLMIALMFSIQCYSRVKSMFDYLAWNYERKMRLQPTYRP